MQVSVSSTKEPEARRPNSNVVLESEYIPLEVYLGTCFWADYPSLFHKSEI